MKWLALLVLMGCAQVSSLNLKKHQFGIQPTKIIWFQVAGLEEEQIAMLRFMEAGERRTSFEQNTCMGKTWSYNLYKMRSSAHSTFLSQLTGKKNIKQDCSDSGLRPIWNFLGTNGYSTVILENGGRETSGLVSLGKCENTGPTFLNNIYYFLRQEAPKGADSYLALQSVPMVQNKYFYDRSCRGPSCDSSLTDNYKSIALQLDKQAYRSLLLVRDFSYLAALEKRDFARARVILVDIEHAYEEALNLANSSDDVLVLLTTGESKFVDMPEAGKSWFEFDKKGSGVDVKRTKLMNLVLASGARSENFCGIYEDSQVLHRILSGPKQQGLEFKIINPFK